MLSSPGSVAALFGRPARHCWGGPMEKSADKLSAREFVWTHRIRQRVAFERIVVTVGNPRERARAQQFLEAMQQANPDLFDGIEQYTLDFFGDRDPLTPELFDDREYARASGRKTALKLPQDIVGEEKVTRRAARDYRDLFHPCEHVFSDAMKGLQFLHHLSQDLFARARVLSIEQRAQILDCDLFCHCGCITPENRAPAAAFKVSDRGRLENVSNRITHARQSQDETDEARQRYWQFFLDRIGDIAPDLLQQ